ncbi:MAG TPA: ribonuclease HII [Cellvibrionales bacterium]|nr:ribonuclease HII [Cellvibrionales bacterium]
MTFEEPDIHYSGHLLAGVDEAGRGPLAGDVVAAAVILDPQQPIEGLADSKKISEKKREQLFEEIHQKAIAVAVGRASVAEIDELNILWASMLAMKRAVEALVVQPEHVVVDGNRVPKWTYSAQAFIKGDQRITCISAGSIIAKVTRDRDMFALARDYPQYGFEKHKGYPTAAHRAALVEHGVTQYHRTTFGPVRAVLEQC